ncbi:MAG TPA: pyridoxal phosphate-dependent aminotransferase [Planctomycetota bacterium]|nr:pyridoxal phosphate-dependent aminotransferase [Planctomycetota bacterium]
MHPASRVAGIPLSLTLALDARAKALAQAGRDIVNMSVGEPDFDAPALVQDAAAKAVRGGKVRYTPAAGTLTLRKVLAEHVSQTRGVPFTADEITVCHSCKHALSGSMLALCEPGDEVLMLLPAWVSYVEIARIAGAVPVSVTSRADCGPDFAAIERAITARTRGVMLNSPNNPSGYVWTRAEIEQLGAIAERHDLWILSDEIYRRLIYEGERDTSPVSISPAVRARSVIVDGASKTYAMTGYRIGFVAARKEIASGVERLHSHLTGCPNAISQDAYEAGLRSEPPEIAKMAAEFDRRRKFLLGELESMGLRTPWPRGAFYAFPDVSPWLDSRGSAGFCEDLLEQQGLALVPGSAFGVDANVRLSYALSIEKIQIATQRLRTFLAEHARAPAAAR